jgi:predicted ATP-grasp superfamily ATP-dependent carboligase
MYICNSIADLKSSQRDFDRNYPVLVQQFIKGEYEVVIIGLTINGQSIIPGFAKKHRDYKGATTFSTIYPVSELPRSVVTSSEMLLSYIGYSGLWGIECIKMEEEFYFIELNLRNDATTYSMDVAGVNLPMAYYHACCDGEQIRQLTVKVKPLNSMVEFDDFNFVLKRTVSLTQWRRELKSCRCRYYYDNNDMAPYRMKRLEYVKFLFNRLFHQAWK